MNTEPQLIAAIHESEVTLLDNPKDSIAIAQKNLQNVSEQSLLEAYQTNGFARCPKFSPELWDQVMSVNLRSGFFVAQGALPWLRAARGKVVNLADVGGLEPWPAYTAHCVSKAGVVMLTKALAVELSGRGIRVNAVAPGVINTGFSGLDLQSDAAQQFLNSRLLIERLGEPEDIAAAVNFLLSDDASFVTGIQLPVDGGWLVR